MESMSYILSTSIFESQGLGILEAMCCGLKPVVFNFPGAENIFPSVCLWTDLEQFKMKFMPYHQSFDYHKWVVDKYSIEKNIHLYKNLINETLKRS